MEDRLDTLIEVKAKQDALAADALALMLADWGYNTAAQREVAAAEPFVVMEQSDLAAAVAQPDLFAAEHRGTLFAA